jgi:hypothetical protein
LLFDLNITLSLDAQSLYHAMKQAYCPKGNNPDDPTPLFPDRVPFGNNQWAPYGNSDGNTYVLVGPTDNNPTTTCLTHEQLYSKNPDWGAGNTELKENILCCMSSSSLEEENAIKEGLDPKWMGVEDGYEPGTYDDAIEFCKSQSRMVCPMDVYCPWGPSKPVLGGHKGVFKGELWSPVEDSVSKCLCMLPCKMMKDCN